MRFISNCYPHTIVIRNGRSQKIQTDDGWQTFVEREELAAEFVQGAIVPYNERAHAIEHFDLNGASQPAYRHDGIAFSGDPETDGMVYVGSDAMMRLSVFDTDDPGQCPPEFKELFEQRIIDSGEMQHTVIRTDTVSLSAGAPFPRWAEMTVEEIVGAAALTGEWDAVENYERNTENRDELLDALVAARSDEAKAVVDALGSPKRATTTREVKPRQPRKPRTVKPKAEPVTSVSVPAASEDDDE